MATISETIPLENLKKQAQPIVIKNPDIEDNVHSLSALVLGEKYNDEIIAYLVEGKTNDSSREISDIEKYRDEIYQRIWNKPLKIQLVDFTFTGNNIGDRSLDRLQNTESYDDGEARRRIAKMIGLKEVPEKDPGALRRLKGKIKIETLSKDFDSVEEIRSVREEWTGYRQST